MNESEKIPEEKNETPENLTRGSDRGEQRRSQTMAQPLTVGIILIVIGAIFMIQRLTDFPFDNWWALFILIPAVNSYSRAWQAAQASGGRLTSAARRAFLGGLIFTAISAIFFFDLDWVIFGPMVLIIAGVAVLLSALLPKQ